MNTSGAKKLIGKVTSAGDALRGDELALQVGLEQLGMGMGALGEDLGFEDVLKKISSKDKAIRGVIRAYKQYIKTQSELQKLLGLDREKGIDLAKQSAFARRITNARELTTETGHGTERANVRLESINAWYREQERFQRLLNADTRPPLVIGDDSQYAFGADTGVRDDFAYLRELEKEQNERFYRRSQTKRGRDAAYLRTQLSEHDLFIHDRKRVIGRDRAEEEWGQKEAREQRLRESRRSVSARRTEVEAYRKYPWMKSLVDSGRVQKSQLPKITKILDSIAKRPVIGQFVKNPVVAGAATGLALLNAYFAASDEGNAKLVNWQNAANLYGTPSKRFTEAALKAGYKDPGQISKVFGSLSASFGNAESFLMMMGKTMGGLSPLGRTLVAKQLGLDENAVALMDIFSGNDHLKYSRARDVNKNKNMAEVIKSLGFSSSAGVGDRYQAFWWSLPGMTSGAARDASNFDYIGNAMTDSYFENIDDKVRQTEDAAESLKESEASVTSGDVVSTTNNSHAIYISTLNVSADNPQTLVDQLYQMSGGNAYGENRAILASMGSGVIS